MRWPIRNQILLPLAAIHLLLALAVSMTATWWSLGRVEREIRERLNVVTETLARTNFPLTPAVLGQMRGLSGAEFVSLDEKGGLLTATLELTNDDLTRLRIPVTEHASDSTMVPLARGTYLVRPAPLLRGTEHSTVLVLFPETSIRAAQREALLGPLLLGAVTLLLTVLSVAFVAQRIGRKMQRIEEHAARIAGGDFQAIPLGRCDDELRDLAESVNRMCAGLDRMTSQIRESERSNLIRQLAGGIAHQLRNALTGARMAVQVHRRRCENPTDASLEVALKQLSLTEEQIRGLVSLVQAEKRTPIPARLSDVAGEVALLLGPICDHRQIELTVHDDAGPAQVHDGDTVRAALLNLCMNAIEATGAGGDVQVHLKSADGLATIDVRDDGPGIPPEIAASLFDPFQTTKPDGMGLGLALAVQAAQAHGGTIEHRRDGPCTLFRMTCRTESPTERASQVLS